jgi:hypothetical protein
MKEQGEGRKILFAASLRDGLAGAISEAIAKASLADTLRPRAAWRGLLQIFGQCRMHRVLA